MVLSNLELMRKRLEYHGGIKQEDRMIKDKWRSFQKSLVYSYQGADVRLVQKFNNCAQLQEQPIYRALINPDKTKQDYDDKILSIDYDTNFGPGDVFNWIGTNTNWIIYLQALTEDAYFRGGVRQCKYVIKFKNEAGEVCETWAAIRGPVETQIESFQKSQIRVDRPNLSLNILMPLNEDTKFAFDRYDRFLFAGRAWQVQAPDEISMKNVLEINAQEYYIDKDEDDIVNEIADAFEIVPVDPNEGNGNELQIAGPTFIKPRIAETYTAPSANGIWRIESDRPVCLTPSIDSSTVSLMWNPSTSGQFKLFWSSEDASITLTKVIVVESLF